VDSTGRAMGRGVVAGLLAGIPQVLIVQAVERPLGLPPDKADIGPRFVQRVAERLGEPLAPAQKWGLAALFHFGYAAGWGALYAVVDRLLRPPGWLAGPALGAVIYAAAFSRWGAGTQSGAEPQPSRRDWHEDLLDWTAALSFSLSTALAYAWLRPARAGRSAGRRRPRRPTPATRQSAAGQRATR
jgi:hypothetical protein